MFADLIINIEEGLLDGTFHCRVPSDLRPSLRIGYPVEEVRCQFKEDPGILEGAPKPDYTRSVEISTLSAQKEMIVPSVLAFLA